LSRLLLFFGRQNLLDADLIDEALALQICQMRPLLIVGQMRSDALRHHQDKRLVIHVQPIAAPDKLTVGITSERAIGFTT
jgi:hypothetical protein